MKWEGREGERDKGKRGKNDGQIDKERNREMGARERRVMDR